MRKKHSKIKKRTNSLRIKRKKALALENKINIKCYRKEKKRK